MAEFDIVDLEGVKSKLMSWVYRIHIGLDLYICYIGAYIWCKQKCGMLLGVPLGSPRTTAIHCQYRESEMPDLLILMVTINYSWLGYSTTDFDLCRLKAYTFGSIAWEYTIVAMGARAGKCRLLFLNGSRLPVAPETSFCNTQRFNYIWCDLFNNGLEPLFWLEYWLWKCQRVFCSQIVDETISIGLSSIAI